MTARQIVQALINRRNRRRVERWLRLSFEAVTVHVIVSLLERFAM